MNLHTFAPPKKAQSTHFATQTKVWRRTYGATFLPPICTACRGLFAPIYTLLPITRSQGATFCAVRILVLPNWPRPRRGARGRRRQAHSRRDRRRPARQGQRPPVPGRRGRVPPLAGRRTTTTCPSTYTPSSPMFSNRMNSTTVSQAVHDFV